MSNWDHFVNESDRVYAQEQMEKWRKWRKDKNAIKLKGSKLDHQGRAGKNQTKITTTCRKCGEEIVRCYMSFVQAKRISGGNVCKKCSR